MTNDEDPPLSLILKPASIEPTPTHSAPKARPPSTFHRLLDLPPELRRMVYRFAVAKHNPIIALCSNSGFGLGPHEPHGAVVDVSLFATSKAIHIEAKEEFLMHNTIRLNDINVSKLRMTEGQRNTIREARHLIVLFQPDAHRNFYQDARVLQYECPRFQSLETFYLVMYHTVEPRPDVNTYRRIGEQLNEWANIWVRKQATIEWRDTSGSRGMDQMPNYIKEKEEFATYLSRLEKSFVKGQRPEWFQKQLW
ncbi:hypothetical protein FKW77_003391 [Venturia effusa]|uniref:Uncharacterized protein n=1 Tax=Venturia effusa TaxID=50376 RepID=A0A517LQY2_9PEZI|nr:hypothetical protein FKW77_003391 [Venturia effusa]